MTDRTPGADGVAARTALGGGPAIPSLGLPDGAADGVPGPPPALWIGPRLFRWGERTHVMGILNVTPVSFSGDGLLAGAGGRPGNAIDAAVAIARRMVEDGADLIDIGGESTRPGHAIVADAEEIARVVPVVRALRAELPDTPLSIDTTKVAVAAAALDAGADLVNDVWGIGPEDDLLRLAAERGVPLVLMHNRAEARYANLMAEVLADLERAIERAVGAGVARDSIVVDPGFGFGKTSAHNLALLAQLKRFTELGVPVLAGLSRKRSLGEITGRGVAGRIHASVAAALIAAQNGAMLLRVHDVAATVDALKVWQAVAAVPLPKVKPSSTGVRWPDDD